MAYTYMKQQAQLKKSFEDKKNSPNLIFNKKISVYFNRKIGQVSKSDVKTSCSSIETILFIVHISLCST